MKIEKLGSSLKTFLAIICHFSNFVEFFVYSFDGSENGQPAEKRKRRTQSVLVEQPSEDKVLVDNVVDNTLALDEVSISFLKLK